MKRRIAVIFIAVVVVAVLGWWLFPNGGGSGDQELVIIGEDYSPMQGLETIKDRFTNETGTEVQILRFDAETLRKKYIGEFQANASNYDIIMGQAFDVGLLASNRWVLDLDQELAKEGWADPEFDLSSFSDELLDLSCRYGGRLWGLPCSAQCMFLWYRKDLFDSEEERNRFQEKYDYPLPQPTLKKSMTWSQYRDVAEFFTRKKGERAGGKELDNDLYGTVLQAKNHLALWFEFQNFLSSFGGGFFTSDGD